MTETEDSRREELVRVGVGELYAWALAIGEGDLPVMLEAKAAGCPDELLDRIFGGRL